MNKGDSGIDNEAAASQRFGKKTAGGVAVVVFLTAYSLAQPWLNERMGWNLPGLRQDTSGNIVADSKPTSDRSHDMFATQTKAAKPESTSTDKRNGDKSKASSETSTTRQEQPATRTTEKKSQPGQSTIKRGPLAGRISPSKSGKATSTRGPPQATQQAGDLRYGLLREIGRDRYMSPAGLLYGPGSAEGHRLEHLRRHVKDDPSRPVHGVFDGGMEGALKTIDQAYEKAKQGVSTSKKVDGRRTIYTVNMGKRIGFLGGKDGARKRNVMAKRVRVVLEGTQVITAYPQN